MLQRLAGNTEENSEKREYPRMTHCLFLLLARNLLSSACRTDVRDIAHNIGVPVVEATPLNHPFSCIKSNSRGVDVATPFRLSGSFSPGFTGFTPAEVSTDDHLELPRIALHFDRVSYGRLRELIDILNDHAKI